MKRKMTNRYGRKSTCNQIVQENNNIKYSGQGNIPVVYVCYIPIFCKI